MASSPAPPPPSKRRRIATPSPLSELYRLGPELGHGNFGTIRLCTHLASGLPFACKSIPKSLLPSPQHLADVLSEIRIMHHLSPHPHVVRLHDVLQDPHAFHLVMELCAGGELFNRIVHKGRYSESEAAPLMKSLVETIAYLHNMGVIHRDIKPENVLLADDSDSPAIKLADFGLALRFSPGEKFTGMAGSAYYIAPEVLKGQYSEEIDIWSAGVILYILLSGVPPFWAAKEEGIFEAIKKGTVDFTGDPWLKVSESAKDLILGMLCSDVQARLTPAQVLEHPWIVRHTVDRQEAKKPQLQKVAPPMQKTFKEQHHGQKTISSSESGCTHEPQSEARLRLESEALQNSFSDVCVEVSTSGAAADCPATLVSELPAAMEPSFNSGLFIAQTSTCDRASVHAQSPTAHNVEVELDFKEVVAAVIQGLERSSDAACCEGLKQVRIQDGCSYRVVNKSAEEQTAVVETSHGRFLVVHDRLRRRFAWKVLDWRPAGARILPCSAGERPFFHLSQAVF